MATTTVKKNGYTIKKTFITYVKKEFTNEYSVIAESQKKALEMIEPDKNGYTAVTNYSTNYKPDAVISTEEAAVITQNQ